MKGACCDSEQRNEHVVGAAREVQGACCNSQQVKEACCDSEHRKEARSDSEKVKTTHLREREQ
eukprot:6458577-Lingulodinium_polyedra.AAC.1